MTCETQNFDIVFNDAASRAIRFDDAVAKSITFDDSQNIDIACAKFAAAAANPIAPQFAGVTSWNWSAKSVEAESDGTSIELWVDRHSSLDATQSTASRRPTKQTDTSLPVVDFDGVDDWLDAPGISLGTQATMFVVAKINFGAAQGGVFDGLVSTGRNVLYNFGGNALAIFAGTNRSKAVDVRGAWAKFEARFDDPRTDSELLLNETVEATGNTGTQTASSGLRFGAFVNGSSPLDGQIAEIIVYDSELSTAQTAEVNSYLDTEWGALLP